VRVRFISGPRPRPKKGPYKVAGHAQCGRRQPLAECQESAAQRAPGTPPGVQRGEAIPRGTDRLLSTENSIREVLERPDEIALNASYARTRLAADADVLEMAVDAADSVRASNSIEKMLTHQMAAAHDLAMKLFYLSTQADLPPLEIPRLANAAARLMESFQNGFLTLHRARGAAKQTIVVQHVQVTGQGQAVVAGALERTTRQEGVPEKR